MPETPQLGLIEIALIAASCGAWCWLVQRLRRGQRLLPQESYPEVRWDFMDVLFVVMVHLTIAFVASTLLLGSDVSDRSPDTRIKAEEAPAGVIAKDDTDSLDKSTQHPIVRLMLQKRGGATFLFVFLVGGISAPLYEEFFFRLLLLGWLTKRQKSLAPHVTGRRILGVFPLVLTSLFFALMHLRDPGEPVASDVLIRGMSVTGIANVATFGLALVYLRYRYGPTAIDFGITSRHFAKDLKTAALAFFIVGVPVLVLNLVLKMLLPSEYALDPIPLFFLALALGWMYLRTGRVTSCMLLHFFFNAFSLLVLLALVLSGGTPSP